MTSPAPSVVHFSIRPDALEVVAEEIRAAGGVIRMGERRFTAELDGLELELLHLQTVDEVCAHLDGAYVSLVVLDLRDPSGTVAFDARAQASRDLLARLDEVPDVEARFGFHRILPLVASREGDAVDALLLEMGAMGIRHALRDDERISAPFGARYVRAAARLIESRRVGRTAICLSGGGTTGIYFELGALKCLADCLPPNALQCLDMIFGISAGAVVGSTLAAGFSVDEFMASIAGVEDTRMPPLDFRVGRPGDLNWRDGIGRFRRALLLGLRSFATSVRWRRAAMADDEVSPWSRPIRGLVGPFFQLERLERTLAEVFEIAGLENRFDRTVTELYIGASDQDRREHVVFGEGDFREVPISQAVQASAAFPPAFQAVEIGGRYFDDGAVTQTSNFGRAFELGATLTLVIDPFLPFVSSEPGSVSRHNVLYQVDQVIRTMSFTRFEQARAHMIRKHPEVSMYTFLPSNRLRHLLAENPLDDRNYLEIWRAAYLSTHARLMRLGHRMKGDFAAHGLTLELDRATTVAEQLMKQPVPTFEDFYPDRRVEIPKPAFAKDLQSRPLRSLGASPRAVGGDTSAVEPSRRGRRWLPGVHAPER